MAQDPFIVSHGVILGNHRDPWYHPSRAKWPVAVGMAMTAIGFGWTIIRTDLSREPELPDRPLTRADVPLIEKKIKFLKKDAETVSSLYPHLKNEAEIQAANKALEEVYYTPEVFPAVEQLHRVLDIRIYEVKPELAGPLQAREKYEQARYAIANDHSITDKAAAIAALNKRSDPAATGSKYSRTAAQVTAMAADYVGDSDFDQAQQAYNNACEIAILKRHPKLAAFYHELDISDEAWHYSMAQANQLSQKVQELQSGSDSPATQTASGLPEQAGRYGVKVGDSVEISALNPVVAAHHALITGMNDEQLTVRVGSDTFTIRWENVDRIKVENK